MSGLSVSAIAARLSERYQQQHVHTGAIFTDAQSTVLKQAIALPVDAGRTAPTISASGCHCVDPNHQLARQTDLLRAADMERPATGSPTLMRPAAQPPQLHPHHLLLANTQKVKPAADDTAQSSTKSVYGEVEITFKTGN